MMIGVQLTIPSGPAVQMCMERGVLINATQDTVVRLLPAININEEEVDSGFEVVAEVLRTMANDV